MIGLHLLNYSTELINFARGAAIVKMVDPDTTSALLIKSASPDAIIILRIHSLSEQHEYTKQKAIEHADALCAAAKAIGATHVEGINEPDVSSQASRWALGSYYREFANRCHFHGIGAIVGNLSVGKPEIADWPDFHEMISAMRIDKNPLKSDFLGLHEYWQFNGPGDGWSWYAGRFIRCPFQVPIIITECGIDQGINLYPDRQKPKCGWRSIVNQDVYAAQLSEYIRLCSSDPRFYGTTPFTFGGGYGWDDFDVTPILSLLQPMVCRELRPVSVAPLAIRVKMDSGEIVSLPLEEYLRGVVPAEVYPSWHINALKAQAVLARSYAMWRLAHPRAAKYDIYDYAGDQVYNPAKINTKTDKAVADTAGIYLIDNSGQPYLAQYVSKCGRNDCEYCSGTDGYDGKIWNGRACQYGLQTLAKTGWDWRAIVKYYYDTSIKLSDE